jgi:hypothetical protein
VRIDTRHALAVGVLALVLPAGFTSSAVAAPAPPCDTAAYPIPFLRLYGGLVVGKTRYIELQIRPGQKQQSDLSAWSDPEYPFPLTVTPSNGAPTSYNVTNYARQTFPARFTSKTQTSHVTATYTEIHTSSAMLTGTTNTRCSRTISATYKAPTPHPTSGGGRSGGGGRHTHGQSEDGDDDDR